MRRRNFTFQDIDQFRVATRLVAARSGLVPTGNSAATSAGDSFRLSKRRVAPPSQSKVLEIGFWKGVGVLSGSGTQMRVGPDGFSTSIRAVISKVRQPIESDSGEAVTREGDSANVAEVRLAWTETRRFIG